MAASAVKVIVVDGKEITQSVDLRTTKQGSATKVKAIKGGKFILADADTGAAPENITVHRVGNDLHVSLEGTGYEDPELIIEGFYSADGQGEELVGVAEDGAYYEYIASDAEANHEAGMLGEGVSSPLVLGRNPLVGFGSGLVPAAGMSWLGLGLFGLGALGLIGAALAGDNGGNPGNPGDGGNPGNPGDGKLTIGDITDNVGTTTGSIPPGGSTDDNTPTIIGDGGTPGKVITIIDNGKPIGSTIVDDDGKWTFTPDNPLDDGPHEIVVIEDGKPPSDGRDIIIDTVAPAQVLIESALDDAGSSTGFLDNGAMTDDKTPTLSGKAEAGSLVKLYADGNEVGSIVADADGNWTITSSELPDGPHKFTATATDAAGNVGLPSADWVVVVDTMEGKPAIGDVTDDVGSKTGTIPNGGDTDDNTPTLSGGGGGGLTPGSTVVISDGGNPIGTAIVGDDGKWEFTPPPLDDGKHDFTVVVTDPAGNTSDPSDPWTVNIDTLAPDAPTIDLVIDDQGASTGPLTSGGPATDDAQPTVSGKAEPNSIVTLYDGDKAVGSTKADASGNWTITPDFPLSLGEHNLTAKASDAAGNISDPSNQFDLDVATGGVPTAPAIIGVNDDNGATPVPVAENGFTNDNTPVVIGTAPAGSVVMIYVDGNPVALGSATSDADGNWSFPVPAANPLTDGLHNFTASAGGVSTGQYPINIDTTAPGASTDLSLIDDVGARTGEIADNDTTDDANPTYSGKAEPGTSVVVIVDGVPVKTVPVDAGGNWTYTPETPLADGAHTISNQVVDQAGNTSPVSAPTHFIVDTGAVTIAITQVDDNEGSITGPISNHGVTDDTTPTVHGTATANSLVHIYVDGNPVAVGSVMADGNGDWVFTPTLTEGPHTITATSTNAAGVVSDSNEFDLTVDTTAPAKPEIGDVIDDVGTQTGSIPSDGGVTDDTTPTLVGGGLTPGDKVIISDGGNPIGTAIVGDDGKWEFTPTTPLNPGDHEFTIVVEDPAGNTSDPSDPWDIVIDTGVPDAPTIDLVIDDQGASTGPLTSGGPATDDAQPTVSGKAEPGSIVTLYDGDKAVGSTQANASGDWTITPDFPLDLGAHNLTAKASDSAGNVSDPSNQFDLDVATGGVPTAPAIIGVIDDDGASPVNVPQNGLTNDNTPVVIGTAPAGSVVMIYVDGNPVALGSAISDADGNWSFPVPATNPLTDGLHNFTATAGGVSTGEYPINIDTTAPSASTDLSLIDDVGVTGPINDNDTTDDANPTYSGKAEPGTSVVVIVDGVPVKTVPVDAGGNWTYTPETPLADGPHTISNQVVDQAGNTSPVSAPTHFIVDTSAVTIAITQVDDNEGSITGPISNHGVTDDTTPTVHGTATANSLVHIYVDGNPVAVGSVMADGLGNWEFTPTLTEGPHTITATSTNAAGVVSDSNEFDLTVDVTAPAKPEIGDVSDDVGVDTGTIPKGDVTDDTTPTIGGGGQEPGDKVTIIDNGAPIGTAIVGDDGSWEFTPTTPLNPGDHDFTVVVTDPAGNTSEPSDPWPIVIDVDAPPAPEITTVIDDNGATPESVAENGFTNDNTPTIVGTAVAGSRVSVHDENGNLVGTATADGDGNWSVTSGVLPDGPHIFTATTTTPSGLSPSSNQYLIHIDTVAPDPTVGHLIDNVLGGGQTVVEEVANGGTTDDSLPEFSGTAEAGTVVRISITFTPAGGAPVTSVVDVPVNDAGHWTYLPDSDLDDGSYSYQTEVIDAAGNHSALSPAYTFTLDTSPPPPVVTAAEAGAVESAPAPQVEVEAATPRVPSSITVTDKVAGGIVGELNDGDFTNDPRPTVSGNGGVAGTVVTVEYNGLIYGSATVEADGSWSAPLMRDLPNGSVVLDVSDATGTATSIGFIVDTMRPSRPIVDFIYDDVNPIDITNPLGDIVGRGNFTDDRTPTLVGRGEIGSIITITDSDGNVYGSVTVTGTGATGDWQFTIPTDLADGSHTFLTTATNMAGNVSNPSVAYTIVVDVPIPGTPGDPPNIVSYSDDVGAVTGTFGSGQATDDTTPRLNGNGAAPNAIVYIYQDGDVTPIGSAQAGPTGLWSFDVPALSNGDRAYVFTATQAASATDPQSAPSVDFTLNLDTTAPIAPTIDGALDNVGAITGNVESGHSTDDRTPQLSGTAEANSIVVIRDGGVVIGSVTANGTGDWTFDVPARTGDAPHVFTAVSHDAAGNISLPSNDYSLTFDTTAPNAPTIDGALDNFGPITGNVDSGQSTDDRTPQLSGTAEANSIVFIRDGGVVIGSATANGTGDWIFDVPARSGDTAHVFTAVSHDAAGNVSPVSNNYDLTFVDPTAPLAPAITGALDDVGTITGNIGSGGTTNDKQPLISGVGEPGAIVRVGDSTTGIWLGSATVGTDGKWSLPVAANVALRDGSHALNAVQDLGGMTSPASAVYSINVDTVSSVTISSAYASNSKGDIGIADGLYTVTAVGRGEPGCTVVLNYGASTLSTTVKADGSWQIIDYNRNGGSNLYTVTQIDRAGNVGTASAVPTRGSPLALDLGDNGFETTSFVASGVQFDHNGDGVKTSTGWLNGSDAWLALDRDGNGKIDSGRELFGDNTLKSDGTLAVDGYDALRDQDSNGDGKFDANDAAWGDVRVWRDLNQDGISEADEMMTLDDAGIVSINLNPTGEWVDLGNGNQMQGEAQFTRADGSTGNMTDLWMGLGADVTLDDGVLKLEGSDGLLDLSQVSLVDPAAYLKAVDITGDGDNTLNLSLNDVLSLGQKGLFIDDGKTQLLVKGDAGDVVNLDAVLEGVNAEGDWTQAAGAVTVAGVEYNVFQHAGLEAELLVQQGVTTNLS
ncbi:hypothetical protein CFter6_4560 [Collimonas fungivorans]|uniref:Bacterial Ig-like domain-containing protein n=1 Tax=Collimonas fungivorans TaxID=158899 RepID=A0A127PH61_9BURK|nr:Ig-like domain-containing protein [Collimonas fungivorans]AMO97150.1 hypothetical protein CFter6_4560 [Collimonas fungivorans]